MASLAAPDLHPSYVALAGPTASGKSACAMALAKRIPVEIISVDSALVFRGMDIGTAKPTSGEQAAAPHHLIDIRDPTQAYSAAEFVGDARDLIEQVRGRGALPLLVGGTMLYFKALFQGLSAMPSADAAVRAALDAQAQQQGWPALHAELERIDPPTAARLAPHDSQRIQRALEVYRLSGVPLSQWHAQSVSASPATPPGLFLSLEPHDRSWLHARIAERFEQMLHSGFLDEVRRLRARGDLSSAMPSMRCVGYRQTWEWLDSQGRESPPALAELCERGVAATRQLAKRQLTWLRSMPTRAVIACDAPDATQRVVTVVTAFVAQRQVSRSAA